MIKTSVIQTFCKIDSEKFSLDTNKSTIETVKNGELVQFGVLLQLNNTTETSKLPELNFTSMDCYVKDLKNVSDISSSIDPKEIFRTICDDIHEDSVTTNLPEHNSHTTNVPRSKTERTDVVLSILQTDVIPCVSNPDHGIDGETNEDMKIKNEMVDATGFRSKTSDILIGTGGTDVIGKSREMIDVTEINNKVTSDSEIINDGLGISIIITDVAGSSKAYTHVAGNDIKGTDVTKIKCEMTDAMEISSDKDGSTTIRNENTADFRITNTTMITNETVNTTKTISELTDSRRIDDKTTDSVLKLDVKSANTSSASISMKDFASHAFQAKSFAKYKGIPKTPKKAFYKLVSKTERTNESQQKVLPNSEKNINAKAITNDSYERKNCGNQTYDLEKFLDAVNLTNKDMVKKSGILLQKQKLVAEVLSYVHAVQSIFRLSTPLLFTNDTRSSALTNGVNKHFYEAGVYILEEMKLYQSELKADFQDWEAYRKKILGISEGIPYEFKLCENKKSERELMHEITCDICDILKKMEIISSKREEKNQECNDVMDGIDTYIKYSSAFIMGENTLTIF